MGIALLLYLPLAWQILSRQVTQNLATFILWGMLDAVAAISLFVQEGNWYLSAMYVFGCCTVIASLLIVKTVRWTWFETAISIMVIICLIGWKESGPRMATILSTTGVVLAGFPQLWDTYKNPKSQPLLVYAGFTAANIFGTLAGKEWSIEERLYPAACVGLCFAIVALCCKRFIRKEEPSGGWSVIEG